MKVYCKDCKYLKVKDITGSLTNITDCSYTDNVQQVDKSDWLQENIVMTFIKHPSDINQHNTCQWYVEKK